MLLLFVIVVLMIFFFRNLLSFLTKKCNHLRDYFEFLVLLKKLLNLETMLIFIILIIKFILTKTIISISVQVLAGKFENIMNSEENNEHTRASVMKVIYREAEELIVPNEEVIFNVLYYDYYHYSFYASNPHSPFPFCFHYFSFFHFFFSTKNC